MIVKIGGGYSATADGCQWRLQHQGNQLRSETRGRTVKRAHYGSLPDLANALRLRGIINSGQEQNGQAAYDKVEAIVNRLRPVVDSGKPAVVFHSKHFKCEKGEWAGWDVWVSGKFVRCVTNARARSEDGFFRVGSCITLSQALTLALNRVFHAHSKQINYAEVDSELSGLVDSMFADLRIIECSPKTLPGHPEGVTDVDEGSDDSEDRPSSRAA